MDPQFWLNLQSKYELRLAQAKIGASLRQLPTLASLRGSEQTT
jgi:plasmid maintenance system antidote protein VapI